MIWIRIEETSPRWGLSWWLSRVFATVFTLNCLMAVSLMYRAGIGEGTPAEPFTAILFSSMGIYVTAGGWYVLREHRASRKSRSDEPR